MALTKTINVADMERMKMKKLDRDRDMPVRMTSEKFIRAERRNRLETHRYDVTCKHYDRANVRLNYEIDREKRSITKAFKSVVKTSGASDVGLPPKNDKDTDFEKCPTYMIGLKLSSKRLLEWRECEKQLNIFIEQHDLENKKPKHKKVAKKANKGSTPQNDENEDVFIETEDFKDLQSDKTSPVDILKADPQDKREVFDVKKWEKDIMDSYKRMVSTSDTASISSQDNDTKSNLRSKSSPVISVYSSEMDTGLKKRTRPHTAHAESVRRPSSGKQLPRRPNSANVKLGKEERETKFLITKDTTFIKTGQKFEKLIDNRPVDKPVLVNNYLDTLSPGMGHERDPSTSSATSLCPVEEGNEDELTYEDDQGEQSLDNLSPPTVRKPFKPSNKLPKRRRIKSAGSAVSSSTYRSLFKQSNSDLSSYVESNRRSRRDSGSMSSVIMSQMSRTGSFTSSHRPSESLGIPADIEEMSRGQDKLANEISAEKPLCTNKLVSITKVVRAAMTFSRVARKRALNRMQEENSSEPHEIIRQERLRRLQSRQNVLNSIAKGWETEEDGVIIEQVQ